MIADIWTVFWKEWRELLLLYGSQRGTVVRLLFSGVIIGVVLPLQLGKFWVNSPVAVGLAGWLPFILVAAIIADSFAGERERHTLETLLASPLSDQAILLGKVGTAVSYGWGYTMLVLLMGLVTVNVFHGEGELLLYRAPVALGAVTLAFLSALLAASVGILVSLRAATVRQAQQQLSLAFVVLALIPSLGSTLLPAQLMVSLFSSLKNTATTQFVFMLLIVLFAVDLGLLLVAMSRFRRSRLILD